MASTAHPASPRLDELLELFVGAGDAGDAHAGKQLLTRRLPAALYHRVAGGVPPAQLQALAVLSGGDMRMRELAHRLSLATSTVTRLVDRLEAAGLAERRSERPDRRSVLVGLSATGHDTLHAARQRLRTLMGELIAGLTPSEQGELLRLLARLGETLVLRSPDVLTA